MAYQAGGPNRAALKSHADDSNSRPTPLPESLQQLRQWPVSADRVLKSFNTRSFKREQPGRPELMLQLVSDAVARREPIRFVMYWGKGLRPLLAPPEYACLDYLASMMSRIEKTYNPGAHLDLVFTDTHARLNGHSKDAIASYYEDLMLAARLRGFSTSVLSTLIEAPGLVPDINPMTQMPPEDLLAELSLSAAKWFRGQGTAREGAVRYFQANMVEKHVMDRAFPKSIFVTFNGSKLKPLFPDNLPIFYMYSLRHGVSDKPWFLPPDAVPESHLMRVEVARTA